jgi:hypothetical protein
VIDLDFAHHEKPNSWYKRFRDFDILGGQELTHIVELLEPNDEIKKRADQLLMTPENGRVFSKWERDVRANRKKRKISSKPSSQSQDFRPSSVSATMRRTCRTS